VAPPGSGGAAEQLSEQLSGLTVGSRGGSSTGGPNGNGANGGAAGRGAMRGVGVRGRELLQTRPKSADGTPCGKQGTAKGSTPFTCVTNMFKVNSQPKWDLIQYRVDFSPEEDRTKERKKLLRDHKDALGTYLFDGTVLWSWHDFFKGGPGELVYTSKDEASGQVFTIKIRRVGVVNKMDMQYVQFYNIMIRKIMEGMNLTMVNRNYYDSDNPIPLKEWKLELWMGYETSMRQHEDSPLLMCAASTKIIRTDTVMDQMKLCMKGGGGKEMAAKTLLGCIVMTRYNNKTYRIDDIDWNKKPADKFQRHDGSEVSYVQYYKERYGITIKDANQPLIISMPTKQEQRRYGRTEPILLIPEICNMTGLSDDQRANFKLMKAVGEYTRPGPGARFQALKKFAEAVASKAKIGEELKDWGLEIDPNPVRFNARTLEPEKILQATGRPQLSYGLDNADWGSQFRNFKMFNSGPGCHKWVLIVSERDSAEGNEFAKALEKSSVGMGFPMKPPKPMVIKDNRTAAFVDAVNKAADMSPQMIMTVIPNNKGDAYHAIKKILCVDRPIPSQVITGTLLKKPKGMMSVATKVAIQMAAKLGAEPWGVNMPLKDAMVIGYDSYHDSNQRGLAVGAVVATTNQAMTRYTSMTTMHRNDEELLNQMKVCVTQAIRKYRETNQRDPSRIIFYRDGVGEGQIQYVKETEVEAIKSVFKDQGLSPQLAFIVVSKRISNKFFQWNNGGGGQLVNPPSGSVVDDVVTLPERYDFYLVSQSVRQGTVNPTSYNIIENQTQFTPDIFQKLTYKLCHLYFNWPGTVRVPNVCQYAHKLAYIVGTSIHRKPNAALDDLLYYL